MFEIIHEPKIGHSSASVLTLTQFSNSSLLDLTFGPFVAIFASISMYCILMKLYLTAALHLNTHLYDSIQYT